MSPPTNAYPASPGALKVSTPTIKSTQNAAQPIRSTREMTRIQR